MDLEVQISWQVQDFVDVEVQILWYLHYVTTLWALECRVRGRRRTLWSLKFLFGIFFGCSCFVAGAVLCGP